MGKLKKAWIIQSGEVKINTHVQVREGLLAQSWWSALLHLSEKEKEIIKRGSGFKFLQEGLRAENQKTHSSNENWTFGWVPSGSWGWAAFSAELLRQTSVSSAWEVWRLAVPKGQEDAG